MGAIKKAYLDWCEQHDVNPEDGMENGGAPRWSEEFEKWLDILAKTSPLSEDEINRMGRTSWVQGELDLAQSNVENKNV